jgi:hypothetical protein
MIALQTPHSCAQSVKKKPKGGRANEHKYHPPPGKLEAEAMLSRGYPDDFTLADRTAERMTRARNGLAHVMTDLATQLEGDRALLAEIDAAHEQVLRFNQASAASSFSLA